MRFKVNLVLPSHVGSWLLVSTVYLVGYLHAKIVVSTSAQKILSKAKLDSNTCENQFMATTLKLVELHRAHGKFTFNLKLRHQVVN